MRHGRSITLILDENKGTFLDLFIATSGDDGVTYLSYPAWWSQNTCRTYRLSGSAWRSSTFKNDKRGLDLGYWGGLARTINGLESMLTWGRTSGRGKTAHLPECMVSVTPGGPGQEVFVPWWKVLWLSGEHVSEATPHNSAAGKRYHKRMSALKKAGYFMPLARNRKTPTMGAAPAGDTVEIRKILGGRGHKAGIMVRPSARLCEAYRKLVHDGARECMAWLPASMMFRDPQQAAAHPG